MNQITKKTADFKFTNGNRENAGENKIKLNVYLIHKILSYIDTKLIIRDYIYLNKNLYNLFDFKVISIKKTKSDFLPREKYASQRSLTVSSYYLADILNEENLQIRNLLNIKIRIKINYPLRPESSRFIDNPYIELNIVDKSKKEESEIARITLHNVNFFERKADFIEISLNNLGLVENKSEKVRRNKAYYSNESFFGSSSDINFPLKELSCEEIEEGKNNGSKFLEFIKENYNENYVIQIENKCYMNKLSEFKEVEMKFLFVKLNR